MNWRTMTACLALSLLLWWGIWELGSTLARHASIWDLVP